MNKALSVIIIGVLLVAFFFIGYFLKETNELQKNDEEQPQVFPSSVLTKYEELEPLYKKSLGASIIYCTKNTQKIYAVTGNGGYGGVIFYYTEDGTEIESYSWGDIIYPDDEPQPEPPVNLQEYNCTIIKESEQFANE